MQFMLLFVLVLSFSVNLDAGQTKTVQVQKKEDTEESLEKELSEIIASSKKIYDEGDKFPDMVGTEWELSQKGTNLGGKAKFLENGTMASEFKLGTEISWKLYMDGKLLAIKVKTNSGRLFTFDFLYKDGIAILQTPVISPAPILSKVTSSDNDKEKEKEADNDLDKEYNFSKKQILIMEFKPREVEEYDVRAPCRGAWFKIFLNNDQGQNSHIEIFRNNWRRTYTRGNIYCHGAGNKDWWGGAVTDFWFTKPILCDEKDKMFAYFKIIKTTKSVKILNAGREVYSQEFGPDDGDCLKVSTNLKTQVFHWGYYLYLKAPGSNATPISLTVI